MFVYEEVHVVANTLNLNSVLKSVGKQSSYTYVPVMIVVITIAIS